MNSWENNKKKLTLCRNQLGGRKYLSKLKELNGVEMIKVLYEIDVCRKRRTNGARVLKYDTKPSPNPYAL